mmetsp:Transcript_7437/g.9042  ORF Transcript_7437/g.9042 Transcript_7437/m.9042 type:complete len:176 (-) Transcript_7437:95-622(-)|eukprot:jgi/Bigna1/74297/fgenesh1_pg.28_\
MTKEIWDESNHDGEASCVDENTSRILMMKAWSHGQIIAAFQGLLYGYWAFVAADMSGLVRLYLLVMACFLPVWTMTSWSAMQKTNPNPYLILTFGFALEISYVLILTIAVMRNNLLAIVFTSLQMFETLAYLSVVAYFRKSLLRQDNQYRRPVEASFEPIDLESPFGDERRETSV